MQRLSADHPLLSREECLGKSRLQTFGHLDGFGDRGNGSLVSVN